jgi:hypothetical protein
MIQNTHKIRLARRDVVHGDITSPALRSLSHTISSRERLRLFKGLAEEKIQPSDEKSLGFCVRKAKSA